MITGKQKRYLKGLANSLSPVTQVGKAGLSESFISQLADILENRELVKVSVLGKNSRETKEIAKKTAELSGADFVQSIGMKFVLYKRSTEKPVIAFPE